ncbi:MAG: AraC family transcriptional regulator [Spirochaetaceae bacterium]|jgi:AraC-like DNA-binding protein|nr:AraC family transcriptional regulator [Spirochaetaceae bacterium]
MDNLEISEELIFFNGGHLFCEKGWLRRIHSHSFYQLLIIYQGHMEITVLGKTYTAHSGDMVFYKDDVPHSESNINDSKLEMIYLDWEGPELDLPLITHDRKGRVRILAEWLLDDYKNSIYTNQENAEDNLMKTLLFEVIKNAESEVDSFIQNVRTIIYEHMEKKLTLEDLASFFAMNKFTFLRKYKSLTGKTPIDDLTNIRVERARDLIISTDLSMNEISRRCGLTNEYNLSRVFQKILKVPPGYYRKNH